LILILVDFGCWVCCLQLGGVVVVAWVLDVGFAAWWSGGLLVKWWSLLDFSGG
jgi:hypothetical protein